MAISQKWRTERSAAAIAECGTGKTIISLAAVQIHCEGRPFTAIVLTPSHVTDSVL
jgi:superfamily II DNA or RNA helicase